jgi:hypothetical protein
LLQENNSVPELREKIKQFLASQGMIKGHSGSGSRSSGEGGGGPILMLSETNPSQPGLPRTSSSNAGSPPDSPQSPPSASTTTSHHYPHIVTSDVRSGAPNARNELYSPLSPDTEYHSPGTLYNRVDVPSSSSNYLPSIRTLHSPTHHQSPVLAPRFTPPRERSYIFPELRTNTFSTRGGEQWQQC